MAYLRERTSCFLGHRKIVVTDELKEILNREIENLITNEKVSVFLFGSKSQFDDLCYNVVSKLKEKYPHIRRVYVRAAFADISDDYTNYLMEYYEESYYPQKIRNAGKATYVERNQEMINHSKFCVVYFNENYLPPKDIKGCQPRSGTAVAYDYAIKKKNIVINVYSK